MSGRTIERRDPVASGGDGVLSRLATIAGMDPARARAATARGGRIPVRARLLVLVAASAMAGCDAGASPASTPGGTIAPIATSGVTLPGQTDTDWGPIWDALPPSFPFPPDGQLATDTGEGPVSAELAIGSGTAGGVAAFYRDYLEAEGFAVTEDGPLEDGGIVVSGVTGYPCRIAVTVRPAGGLLLATVMYGAACPFV